MTVHCSCFYRWLSLQRWVSSNDQAVAIVSFHCHLSVIWQSFMSTFRVIWRQSSCHSRWLSWLEARIQATTYLRILVIQATRLRKKSCTCSCYLRRGYLILGYNALHKTRMLFTIPGCNTLDQDALHYATMLYTWPGCFAQDHDAIHWPMMPYTGAGCSTLEQDALHKTRMSYTGPGGPSLCQEATHWAMLSYPKVRIPYTRPGWHTRSMS